MTRRSEITAEMAQAERALRQLARMHLCDFGEYIYPWWKPAEVHRLICGELENVGRYIESGGKEGVGALILEMPPQHGKTTIVSRLLTSWMLGKLPNTNVILTSYNDELAGDNSREVRNIVTSERFDAVFGQRSAVDEPVSISEDSTARASWHLAEPHRGSVRAAGVGGGTTGRPADLIIVDDPFKNREEAESPQARKKILKWYTSSILSRRRKGTAIVIIHTRWNREDLIGEAIKAMKTDPKALQYKVVSLPAFPLEPEEYAKSESEQDQAMLEGLFKPMADPLGRAPGSSVALWPDEFPQEMLEQIRSTLEASGEISDWYALYQQQPRPADGVFFSTADFPIVERIDSTRLRWFRYIDLAISEKKTADWNATIAEALDGEGILYQRDMLRVHGWIEFKAQLKALMLSPEERGTIWGVEDVNFQALAFLELISDAELAAVAILAVRPNGDKVSRARALQSRARAGKVRLLKGPWNQTYISECVDFPTGRHDDQVDTASGGLQMIADFAQAENNQEEIVVYHEAVEISPV